MRVVEHRRHSLRQPSDPHLSREGVALARRVGATIGRFDRVVTSPKTRAVETAEALGFSVDETLNELAEMPDEVEPRLEAMELRSYADYVRAIERSRAMSRYAHRRAELMREELEHVPSGGRLLVISHAGVVEFSAAAARPKDAVSWGAPAGILEGARLSWERGKWVRGEVLRVPK